jgi:membrane-bound metal-dependent hydrolase YbcI (DUF457 family)
MVLGHLTVTAAAYRLLRPKMAALAALPLWPLLAGTYVPDLVDKPLNFLVGLSSRGYGHSLVMQVLVFGLAWLFFARSRLAIVATALGAGIHLLQDWVHIEALLAPLLGPIPFTTRWGLVENFFGFYRAGGPLVWIEVAAMAYWLAVAAARLTR